MRSKAAILGSVLFIAAACGGGNPGGQTTQQNAVDSVALTAPVSLTVWHALTSDPQKGAFEAMVKQFNDTVGKDKGISVTALNQGNYTQLGQKAQGAITAGALPEIIHAYESNVADYMKADVVVSLDPYVSSTKYGLDKTSQDDIYQPYYDTNRFAQFNNQLLSFPFTKSMFISYQSDDLLKAVGKTTPKTWAEFEDAVKAITQKGADGKTTRYGWAVPLDASNFNGWVYSRGGTLMSADQKTVKWDGKEGLEALQLLDRMIKGGYAYVPKGFDYQNDFAANKIGFFMGSTSTRPFVAMAVKTPFNWSIAQVPQNDPAKAKTVMYGANAAILKSTPEKQLASWLFLKWFSDTDQTAKWATQSFYMPVRKSAQTSPVVKDYFTSKDPQGKQAFDLIATTSPEPNVRGQQDIRDVIFDMLTKVTTGTATPEDALKAAGAKANQILKDNQ
jgi:ABC-type glycerol-3-phosphate transport system substrate-binding protein